jgi:hypothetical protein
LFKNKLSTKRVNDSSDRRSLSSTDKVKVQHSLDGLGLHAIDKSASVLIEEFIAGRERGAFSSRGGRSRESSNAVVGRAGERTDTGAVSVDRGNVGIDVQRGCHDSTIGKLRRKKIKAGLRTCDKM